MCGSPGQVCPAKAVAAAAISGALVEIPWRISHHQIAPAKKENVAVRADECGQCIHVTVFTFNLCGHAVFLEGSVDTHVVTDRTAVWAKHAFFSLGEG